MPKIQEEQNSVLKLAVELGYLSRETADSVAKRHDHLHRAGLSLNLSQTMIERQFLSVEQVKTLRLEQRLRKGGTPGSSTRITAITRPIGKLGQFIVLQEIDEQGSAHVFIAKDTVMDRYVTLKILPQSACGDHQWRDRFKREIQLVAKLSHPNILTALSAGEINKQMVIVFQHFDGSSLAERLEHEGNIPEREAWMIAMEICKGLAHALRSDVIHRNISPDSVWCCDDGRIKIRDMGMAKSKHDNFDLTVAGTTVGAPFYMSPEQTKGTTNLDQRTDIYSLGCTMFHILTGSVPFVAEQMADVMHMHLNAPRPSPRSLLQEISEQSSFLVMRMMAVNPDKRPQTPEALLSEIENMMATLPESKVTERAIMTVNPSLHLQNQTLPKSPSQTASLDGPDYTKMLEEAAAAKAYKKSMNELDQTGIKLPVFGRKSAFRPKAAPAEKESGGSVSAGEESASEKRGKGVFGRLFAFLGSIFGSKISKKPS